MQAPYKSNCLHIWRIDIILTYKNNPLKRFQLKMKSFFCFFNIISQKIHNSLEKVDGR